MARQNGAYVEYQPESLVDDSTNGTILSVFGSHLAALISAVDHGNKVVWIEHGETLSTAIARAREEAAKPAAPRPPRAPRKPKPATNVAPAAEETNGTPA